VFDEAVERAKIKDFHFHVLRHTFLLTPQLTIRQQLVRRPFHALGARNP